MRTAETKRRSNTFSRAEGALLRRANAPSFSWIFSGSASSKGLGVTSADIPLGKYETRLILVIVLGQVPVIIKQRTPAQDGFCFC